MNLNDERRPEPTTSDVAGVWSRVWEEDPLGDSVKADKTTLVLWTQSRRSGIYVDMRLPTFAPGRSVETAQSHGYDPMSKPNPAALQATGMTLPLVATSSDGDGSSNDEASSNDDRISKLLFSMTDVKSFAGRLEYTIGDATKSGEALRIDKELARLVANAETAKMAKKSTEGDQQQQQQRRRRLPPVSTCYWERIIDYQPPTGGYDIGVCAPYPIYMSDNNGVAVEELRETGDDGSYAELWRRMSGSSPSSSSSSSSVCFAMELLSEENNDNDKVQRHGYWVRTNQYFAYVVGRPNTSEDAVKLGCVPKSSELSPQASDDNDQSSPSSSSVAVVGKSLEDAINTIAQSSPSSSSVAVVGKSLEDAINTIAPIPPARVAAPATSTKDDDDRDDTKTTKKPKSVVPNPKVADAFAKTDPNPEVLPAQLLQLRILGSYVCLFGKIGDENDNDDEGNDNDDGSRWKILHSTDPGLVGCTLVGDSKKNDGCCCSTVSLGSDCKALEVGATIVQSIAGEKSRLRRWKVVEMDGPSGLPGL